MNCLRVPVSIDDANSIISACAGTEDWRPQFLLGLGTVGVVALVIILAVALLIAISAGES